MPEPRPKRLLYVEPLRRRMRVRFGGVWIADSGNVLLLFELDGTQLRLEPGQTVIPHGRDRDLTAAEALPSGKRQ